MTTATDDTLGFIGLGSMGGALAERILAAGHPLWVYDISAAARDRFAGRAQICASTAEIADRATIVFVCLPSLESTFDVVLGEGGVASGRAVKLYVHLGTTGVDPTRRLADGLAQHGIEMIDAPITGGRARAMTGGLSVIASGAASGIARATPYMSTYANKIFHVSEHIGDAQKMKLVNNILAAANLALSAEALVVGAALGLDSAMMVDVINNGSGQNSATLSKLPRHVLTGSFDFGSTLSIVEKDLGAYLNEAAQCGVETPLGRKVLDAFLEAKEQEGSIADMTTVIRPMERSAGVECRTFCA